jgi:hypothetical protein
MQAASDAVVARTQNVPYIPTVIRTSASAPTTTWRAWYLRARRTLHRVRQVSR